MLQYSALYRYKTILEQSRGKRYVKRTVAYAERYEAVYVHAYLEIGMLLLRNRLLQKTLF